MAGNRAKPRVVLQPRDLHLLRELHILRVIDRECVRVVAGLHSVTRANTRLLALTLAGYLRRVAVGTVKGGHKYLYVLTRQGALAGQVPYGPVPLQSHAVIAGQPFLEHQFRLNALYVCLRYLPIPHPDVTLRRWITFTRALDPQVPLIPDAYAELQIAERTMAMFVEIDQGTEPLRVWRRKVEHYLALAVTGVFRRLFHHEQFRVLVIVPTPKRLASLRACIATMTDKIFWLTTTAAVDASHLWEPVWYRPRADQPSSLI
jgi:Replication-relaxation